MKRDGEKKKRFSNNKYLCKQVGETLTLSPMLAADSDLQKKNPADVTRIQQTADSREQTSTKSIYPISPQPTNPYIQIETPALFTLLRPKLCYRDDRKNLG